MNRFEIIKEFWHFLMKKKKYWMVPLVLLILILGLVLVLGEGSVLAPLVYPF